MATPADSPLTAAEAAASYPVRVVRSTRRKKTVSARLTEGVIEVRVPSWLSEEQVAEHVAELSARILDRESVDRIDLEAMAARLAARFELPTPASIRFVGNQNHRWGSCTLAEGTIRISDRLAGVPEYVLEYVVLHELTHLVEPGHGPRFHELMARYPTAERAEGYLEGFAHGTARNG